MRHWMRPSPRASVRLQEVHRRRADEGGDEEVPRVAVDLHRGADLLQLAEPHDRHPVGEHHRLFLVVGDEDGGGLEFALQALDLGSRVHPERGVEVRQRLVHQQHRGVAHHGAAHRHPLALAAAELRRAALEEIAQVEHVGRDLDLAANLRALDLLLLEAEAHVLARGHVRVERVVLEHHGDVALVRLQPADVGVVEQDRAARNQLEPGDAVERGALAASGGTQEGQELAVRNREAEPIDRDHLGEALGEVLQGDAGHAALPIPSTSRSACPAPGSPGRRRRRTPGAPPRAPRPRTSARSRRTAAERGSRR